jgi:hypothetical protein
MAEGMEPNVGLRDRFPVFATLPLMVLLEYFVNANPNLSKCDRLWNGYSDDKQIQHCPKHGRHHEILASHGQCLLLALGSKHICHHRGQILHDESVAQYCDMELSQTDLI